MKILHFCLSFLPKTAGAEIVTHNLALHQKTLGHDTYVLTTGRNCREIKGSVPYVVLGLFPKTDIFFNIGEPYSSFKKWYFSCQIKRLQARYRFDLWNIHMLYPAGAACIDTLTQMGIKTVVTSHGNDIQRLPDVDYGVRLNPNIDSLIRKKIKGFDAFVAITRSIHDEFLAIGVKEYKIKDISNGANVLKISDMQVNSNDVRNRYSLPLDKKILLTVGRNHPKKGHDGIPLVLAQLTGQVDDCIWLVVGRGNEPLKLMANKLGVGEKLTVIDHIGQSSSETDPYQLPSKSLIEIYKACDVFVSPTLMESFGLVFVEAMAAGLPIVSTEASGVRDIIHHKEHGLLSPVGDVDAMVSNLVRILVDNKMRNYMAKKNPLAAKQFEWSLIAKGYIDLYSTIIRG